MNIDLDLIEDAPLHAPAVRGRISRAWRRICHSRQHRAETSRRAHRRDRRAVRATLTRGVPYTPAPLTAWEID